MNLALKRQQIFTIKNQRCRRCQMGFRSYTFAHEKPYLETRSIWFQSHLAYKNFYWDLINPNSLDEQIWVFPKIGGKPPKWMVKIMENPMNKWMIWGVFPLFLDQHPFGNLQSHWHASHWHASKVNRKSVHMMRLEDFSVLLRTKMVVYLLMLYGCFQK